MYMKNRKVVVAPRSPYNEVDFSELMPEISTQRRPEVCEYPDSNKYLMMTGDKRGIVAGGRMHRAETDLDYWDGEP